MTCEHCPHCQANTKAAQAAANQFDPRTPLDHPRYGRVYYWRGEEGSSFHVVTLGDDPDAVMVWVSGEDLTPAIS